MIKGILRQIQGWIKIKGGTDGTFIGNSGDKLKVNDDAVQTILTAWNPNHTEILTSINSLKELIVSLTQDEITLKDGLGRGNLIDISKTGELKIVGQLLPDDSEPVRQVPFTQDLVNSSGASDARVDGSTNNIDFFIQAETEEDLYLNTLSFLISDVNSTLSQFGNIGSLTNGVQLVYFNSELGEVLLADSLQSNFDFVRLCGGVPPFGDSTTAFQAGNVGGPGGNSEGYIPTLKFKDQFGLNFGLRLRAKTKDKVIIRVRDNLSSVDEFNIVGYGFKKLNGN